MEIKENDNILKPVNSGNEASVSITMHVAHKYNSFTSTIQCKCAKK